MSRLQVLMQGSTEQLRLDPAPVSPRSRCSASVVWILLFAALIMMYGPGYLAIADTAGASSDVSAYAPILWACAAWLFWRERNVFLDLSQRRPRITGLILLILGALLYGVGRANAQPFLAALSQFPILAGTASFLIGWRGIQRVWFPICFLSLVTPLAGSGLDQIVSLGETTALLVDRILHLIGYPTPPLSGEQNIDVPRMRMPAPRESGSLFTLCWVGCCYVWGVGHRARWRNCILLTGIIPIALGIILVRPVLFVVISEPAQAFMERVFQTLAPYLEAALVLLSLFALDTVLGYLNRGSQRPLGRATMFLLSGNLGLVILQALQFFILARWLGAEEFGRIAAINALLTICIPFADLGFGNLLQMRGARDASLGLREFGTAVCVTVVVGTSIAVLLVGVAILLYGQLASPLLVLFLSLAELVCFRVVWLTGQLFAAREQFGVTSAFYALPLVCRVLALGVLLVPGTTTATWGLAVLILAFPLFVYAVLRGTKFAGGWRPDWDNVRVSVGEAIHFSLGTVAQGLYTDLDKVLLGRFGTAVELGAYTSAYRMIAMASMPVRSLLQATSSRYFREGGAGLTGALRVSSRVVKLSVPYACLAAVGIYMLAPLLPLVLGPSFESAVGMLQTLAPLPILQAFQIAYSDALTGAGKQSVRTRLQLLVVTIYGLFGLYMIPRFGWAGAVVTCYVGEISLAVIVIGCIGYLKREIRYRDLEDSFGHP